MAQDVPPAGQDSTAATEPGPVAAQGDLASVPDDRELGTEELGRLCGRTARMVRKWANEDHCPVLRREPLSNGKERLIFRAGDMRRWLAASGRELRKAPARRVKVVVPDEAAAPPPPPPPSDAPAAPGRPSDNEFETMMQQTLGALRVLVSAPPTAADPAGAQKWAQAISTANSEIRAITESLREHEERTRQVVKYTDVHEALLAKAGIVVGAFTKVASDLPAVVLDAIAAAGVSVPDPEGLRRRLVNETARVVRVVQDELVRAIEPDPAGERVVL